MELEFPKKVTFEAQYLLLFEVNQSKESNKKQIYRSANCHQTHSDNHSPTNSAQKLIPSNPYPRSRKATAASNTLHPVHTEPDTVENTEKKKHIGG